MHAFIMDLYCLPEHCGFGELHDELIRDRIVVGLRDSRLSEKLQLQADLTLESAVTAARQTEQVKKEQASLKGKLVGDGKQKQVDAVEKEQSQGKRHGKRGQHSKPPSTCTRCGRSPLRNKSECPAKDEQCHQCGKRGHFKRMCRNPPRVNTIQQEAFLGEVKAKKDSQWMVELLLNGSPVSFKVDTGADMTVVPEKTLKSIKGSELRPAETALYGPNRQRIPSLGQATMVLQKGDKEIKEEVFVVPQADQALLGKPAIEALGLLQRIDVVNEEDDVTVIKQRYPKLFQGLGKLAGKYKIRLKEDANPFALSAPRRIAVPLLPKVKKELQRMESLGVISKQTEPTKWCSGIVVVPKSNDQVRICVDLTQLNESVYRERHVLPTVEQVLAQISGARYFSKLDANSGFWQVPLDKESSPLTTFVTPFGRYRFNRLPFGITSAPEHFQRRMMELLGDLQGVVYHIDDVLIHGSAKDGHNQNLDAVMQEANLTLNEEKCQFCTTEVHFLGQIVDVSGVRPDPEKVAAIQNFPKPTCVGDIRRFLGMVNQLNKFTPNLADKTKPLNNLLVKKNQWVWGDVQQKA